jgi:hypothetical protein
MADKRLKFRWQSRTVAILVLAAVACLTLSGCVPIPIREGTTGDDKYKSTGWMILEFPWPATMAEWEVVKVRGHHYTNPRGAGYVDIPGRNTVLFVTGGNGKAMVHLVDLKQKRNGTFPPTIA